MVFTLILTNGDGGTIAAIPGVCGDNEAQRDLAIRMIFKGWGVDAEYIPESE